MPSRKQRQCIPRRISALGKTEGIGGAYCELTSQPSDKSLPKEGISRNFPPKERRHIHPVGSSERTVSGLCPPCTSGPALKWTLASGSRRLGGGGSVSFLFGDTQKLRLLRQPLEMDRAYHYLHFSGLIWLVRRLPSVFLSHTLDRNRKTIWIQRTACKM